MLDADAPEPVVKSGRDEAGNFDFTVGGHQVDYTRYCARTQDGSFKHPFQRLNETPDRFTLARIGISRDEFIGFFKLLQLFNLRYYLISSFH